MYYICLDCGKIYDEDDVPTYRDCDYVNIGVGYQKVRDEVFIDRCECGGFIDKARICRECGEFYPESVGYCRNCD